MNKIISFIFFLLSLIYFSACDPENVIDSHSDVDTIDTIWDAGKVIKISFNTSTITCGSKNVDINGTILTINKKGTYEIAGSLTEGQIIVNADGVVRLILNNVTVTNSKTSPLFVQQATKAILILPSGTINTLTDGANYTVTKDSLNATIYSKDYLSVYGEGELNIRSNFNTGILSKDELILSCSNLNVNSVGSGIKASDFLKIINGKITVTSGGDAIKAENDTLSTLGYIEIENGNLHLTSHGDAISATGFLKIHTGKFTLASGGGYQTQVTSNSSKGLKANEIIILEGIFNINSSDNCIDSKNNITINNGQLLLLTASKSINCDSTFVINKGEITIQTAVKGISAYNIVFNGGTTSVLSSDDCIKATLDNELSTDDGSKVLINNGTVFLNTTKGDGIDSNGKINILGGTLVIQGSSSVTDYAIKYRSSFQISGGTIIANGGSSLLPTTNSLQNSVYIKFNTATLPGTIVHVKDEVTNNIFIFKTVRNANCIFASLPTIVIGSTYNLFTGGSVVGTNANGLYLSGVVTGGTLKSTFKVSEKNSKIVVN